MTPEQRHKCMSHIKAKDTKPELALRKALRDAGLTGYRKNLRSLPGTPDVAFTRYKVAVFADGDFWHGRDWGKARPKLEAGKDPGYWVSKIERNIERDRRVNAELERLGWTVIRLWGSDILKDPEGCARIVKDAAEAKRNSAIRKKAERR